MNPTHSRFMEVKQMKLVYPAHSKHYFYFRQHISKFVEERFSGVPTHPQFSLLNVYKLLCIPRSNGRSRYACASGNPTPGIIGNGH